MSSPSNTDRRPQWAVNQLTASIGAAVTMLRGTAFWSTVLLPVLVPLLVAVGVVAVTPTTAVSSLAAYCACAVLGHDYSPN